jgi:hypothetical protein
MQYEIIWHLIDDIHYLVEGDDEEDAMGRLNIWICDPDEENAEGITYLDGSPVWRPEDSCDIDENVGIQEAEAQ